MSYAVKHGRRDGNHTEIGDALRSVKGAVVHDTADAGDGFPDYVVGFATKIVLLEVKDGSLPPSRRKLTEAEERFHEKWSMLPVFIVNNVDEAYRAIGLDLGEAPS